MGCFKLHIEDEPTLRLAYSKKGQKPLKISVSYYPFGLQQKGYNDVVTSNVNSLANRFGYGGKELQEGLGLRMYDFGARLQDPSLGRWFVVDALADQPEQIFRSPYAYGWNNPIFYTDPDGNCPACEDFFIGVANGALDTLVNMGDTVAHPIDTFVELANDPVAVGNLALNSVSGGLYGAFMSDVELGTAIAQGDAEGAGENIGGRVTEGAVAGATGFTVSKTFSVLKNLIKGSKAGTANVLKYEGTPENPFGHYAVETNYKGNKITTDQIITKPDLSQTTIRSGGTGEAAQSVAKVKLPNASAAQSYQKAQIGKQLGPYNKRCNSCVTHVGGVLREGGLGIPNNPLREFGIIKTLFD